MKFLLSKRGSVSVCLLCFLISLVLVVGWWGGVVFFSTFLILDLICLILTPLRRPFFIFPPRGLCHLSLYLLINSGRSYKELVRRKSWGRCKHEYDSVTFFWLESFFCPNLCDCSYFSTILNTATSSARLFEYAFSTKKMFLHLQVPFQKRFHAAEK